ncbi:MAG: methyltransferase domain-containing protein [Anaerolineaceae bacterium]
MIEIRHTTIVDSSNSQFAYDNLYSGGGIDLSDSYYLWLLEKINPIPGKLLIDVSCGRGKLGTFARKKGMRVIGLDFSLSAVRVAQQNDPELNLIISDGEQIALKGQCADYVAHIGNLEHYQNPSLGVQEVARILKPGGTAIILLPNGFSIAGNVQHIRRTGQVFDDGQPIQRYNTRQGWQDLLEANGLSVFKTIRYEHFLPRTKRDWFSHIKRPSRLLRWALTWLIPFNLSNCFVYFCKHSSTED